MNSTETLKMNLPSGNDIVDIEKLNENFEKIDVIAELSPVKQKKEDVTEIDVSGVMPYIRIINKNDIAVNVTDVITEEVINISGRDEAVIYISSREIVPIKYTSILPVSYEYFIPASEIKGGGGGGTTDYTDLSNKPQINGNELTGNKTAAQLGLLAGTEKGVANGLAILDEHGKVPSSQLIDYRIYEVASESYAKVYKLQIKPSGSDEWVDVTGASQINIPKDMVVESGSVKECTVDGQPSGFKKGDKYIDLVIANKTDSHIYIPVNDLVDNKAVGIEYDNTDSELEAENVQEAIDEIAEAVSNNETEISDMKTQLDNKVQKTSVSSSTETTSVINVTDAKAQMAMVAKIIGKTHKTVNLFDIDTVCATVSGFRKVDAETFVVTNSTVTVMTGFKANTQYAFSGWVKNNVTGGAVRFRIVYTDNSVTDIVQNNDTGTMIYRYNVSAAGKTISKLQIYYGASGEATYKQFMVEESNVIHDYEPYGQLWSAPVESVVSIGENRAELLFREKSIGSDGNFVNIAGYDLYVAKVKNGTQYRLGKDGDNAVYAYYISFPEASSVSYNGSRVVTSDTLITAPIDGYVVFRTTANTNAWCNEGTTLKAYSPYNKTTVSVPSAVKNLPDYGCSVGDIANEIDFENGVYNQNVYEYTIPSATTWYNDGTGIYYTTSVTPLMVDSSIALSQLGYTSYANYGDMKSYDKSLWVGNSAGRIYYHDNSITSVANAAKKFNGTKVIYELKDKKSIPLKDFIRPLPVENGGTLTLVNEHNLDINSVIKYKKEV